ncbi:hypothetical protein [Rufibacter soli]
MEFIQATKEEMVQIRKQHGDDYIKALHVLLAEKNGLHTTQIYQSLLPLQKVKGQYYVVAVIDDESNCSHVGFTESPFSYWVNLLSTPNDNSKVTTIKEILILGKGLDKKEALRLASEYKKGKVQIARRNKIGKLLADL